MGNKLSFGFTTIFAFETCKLNIEATITKIKKFGYTHTHSWCPNEKKNPTNNRENKKKNSSKIQAAFFPLFFLVCYGMLQLLLLLKINQTKQTKRKTRQEKQQQQQTTT